MYVYEEEIPTANCPKCHVEYDDYDGEGVTYCPACGYCEHLIVSHGRCALCGEPVEKEGPRR